MAHIIAARLQEQDQIAVAISALQGAGFPEASITSFYVGTPGQHDIYPLGGDREDSPGAKHATEGLVVGAGTGGVVGAAVGALGMPVVGPAGMVGGALLGAYVGSLVGGLAEMKEKGASEAGGENEKPLRHAGMLVAVSVPDSEAETRAINILKGVGGHHMERAEGTIANGEWQDFDPLSAPKFVTG